MKPSTNSVALRERCVGPSYGRGGCWCALNVAKTCCVRFHISLTAGLAGWSWTIARIHLKVWILKNYFYMELRILLWLILLCRNVARRTVMVARSAGSLSRLLKGLVQDSIPRSLRAGDHGGGRIWACRPKWELLQLVCGLGACSTEDAGAGCWAYCLDSKTQRRCEGRCGGRRKNAKSNR